MPYCWCRPVQVAPERRQRAAKSSQSRQNCCCVYHEGKKRKTREREVRCDLLVAAVVGGRCADGLIEF